MRNSRDIGNIFHANIPGHMFSLIFLVSTVSVMLLLNGCSGQQDSPDFDEDWCLDPNFRSSLVVDVDVNGSFSHYVGMDSVFRTRAALDDASLKHYVVVYSKTKDSPVAQSEGFGNVHHLSLKPGKYTLVTWADYELKDEGKSLNFYTDDFSELLLKNKYSYEGASPVKPGYRGIREVSVAYTSDTVRVAASPAMGLYRLIATDTVEYVPAKTVVKYTSKIPSSINLRDGKFNWWWNNISFSYLPEGNLLAADHLLSQPEETSVTVSVEVYDEKGYLRARKKNLVIPLVNGGITTVRGNFLSVLDSEPDEVSGNGVSIKTEWDGDIEIEIK